jgi:hypothetical protein
MFDPTLFNFSPMGYSTTVDIWKTFPTSEGLIGTYEIEYSKGEDWWDIFELYTFNDDNRRFTLYSGKIPDNDFGFQLLKNMELLLPVIQREIKINEII